MRPLRQKSRPVFAAEMRPRRLSQHGVAACVGNRSCSRTRRWSRPVQPRVYGEQGDFIEDGGEFAVRHPTCRSRRSSSRAERRAGPVLLAQIRLGLEIIAAVRRIAISCVQRASQASDHGIGLNKGSNVPGHFFFERRQAEGEDFKCPKALRGATCEGSWCCGSSQFYFRQRDRRATAGRACQFPG